MPIPFQGLWTSITGWLPPRRREPMPGDARDLEALRGLFDAASIAIVTLAKDGTVSAWNRAAERLFGWKSAETIGQPPPFMAPETRAAEAALRQRVLAGNELFRRRGQFVGRDGGSLELVASATPQRDNAGRVIGIVNVFEEPGGAVAAANPAPPAAREAQNGAGTAARPVAQPAAATSRADFDRANFDRAGIAPPSAAAVDQPKNPTAGQRMAGTPPLAEPASRSLGFERPSQFLAHVSHDLRQPLHALSLLTGALERRVKEPDSRELVENAGTMIRALQDTFDNIVDLSRLDEGQVVPQWVSAPAGEMLEPVAAEFARSARKRGIAFDYVASTMPIRVDPVLLQRILRQLLGNALRFAERPDGTAAKILLGARRSGDRLRLIVADNGIGVPPDRAAAIFEPFVQLDAGRATGGLGLGLAIARRLARLLKTDLALRSEPGKGSQFWIDVDLAPPGK